MFQVNLLLFLDRVLKFDYNYLCRYDDYIECVHKSKQNLRVKAMHKKRHVDNHIEYLQVGHHTEEDKKSKSHTFRAKEPMLRPMRLLPRPMPTWSHGMTPSKISGESKIRV